jgi:hypothetical protein
VLLKLSWKELEALEYFHKDWRETQEGAHTGPNYIVEDGRLRCLVGSKYKQEDIITEILSEHAQ